MKLRWVGHTHLPPSSLLPPSQISPRDLKPREEVVNLVEVQLNTGLLDATTSASEAAARILKRGFDNMVYASVVLMVREWRKAAISTAPLLPTTSLSLSHTHSPLLSQGMRELHSGDMPHQWSLDDLGQLPIDLPNVYAAACAGFLSKLSDSDREGVVRLISVSDEGVRLCFIEGGA